MQNFFFYVSIVKSFVCRLLNRGQLVKKIIPLWCIVVFIHQDKNIIYYEMFGAQFNPEHGNPRLGLGRWGNVP
jgi:hypothetical protein